MRRAPRIVGYWILAAMALVAADVAAGGYVVKPGDSLWLLARQHGVSVEALMNLNGLKSDHIRSGQTLKFPADSSKKEPRNPKQTTSTPRPKGQKESAKSAKPKSSRAEKSKEVAVKKVPATKASGAKNSTPSAKKKGKAPALAKSGAGKAKPQKSQHKPEPERPHYTTRAEREAAEQLYMSPSDASADNSLEERAPSWVMRPPSDSTQGEKSIAARGGVYPCSVPETGFSGFRRWVQVAPMAHVLLPSSAEFTSAGEFDVMFHFHGREPIRKEWVAATKSIVLVAVDVGIDSSSYSDAFSDPRTFGQVVRAVEAHVRERLERPELRVGQLGVSSWSAGYGAVEQIIGQPYGQESVDSVVLLDGLHAGYVGKSLDGARLKPFVEFARQAQQGEKLMFLSHSSIRTQGYASTTETAQYLAWKVGGKPASATPLEADPLGLERVSSYSSGNLHIRGFRGSGAADHCAHIGLMSDVVRVHLSPRWNAPAKPAPLGVASTRVAWQQAPAPKTRRQRGVTRE